MCDNECGAEAQHWCAFCEISLCDACWPQTHRLGKLKTHQRCPLSQRQQPTAPSASPTCAKHGNQPIILFCRKTQVPFCNQCFAESTDEEKASCCSLSAEVLTTALQTQQAKAHTLLVSIQEQSQKATRELAKHMQTLESFLKEIESAEDALQAKKCSILDQLRAEQEALQQAKGPELEARLGALQAAMQQAQKVTGMSDEMHTLGFLPVAVHTVGQLYSERSELQRREDTLRKALDSLHVPRNLADLNRAIQALGWRKPDCPLASPLMAPNQHQHALYRRFTFENWPSRPRRFYSEPFLFRGISWKLLCFPQGNFTQNRSGQVAVYYGFANRDDQHDTSIELNFTLSLIHPRDSQRTRKRRDKHTFTHARPDWGFYNMVDCDSVPDFLENDTLTIDLEVQ